MLGTYGEVGRHGGGGFPEGYVPLRRCLVAAQTTVAASDGEASRRLGRGAFILFRAWPAASDFGRAELFYESIISYAWRDLHGSVRGVR